MKRIFLSLLGAASLAVPFAPAGCSNEPNDSLSGAALAPNSPASGGGTTYNHDNSDPGAQPGTTGGPAATPSAPVAAARYHGCTKVSYAALGSILASRGAKLTGDTNALTLYRNGGAALGVTNYAGRVPEALVASTSAMAKEFDILVAAAPELVANAGTTAACQGISIVDASGKFTKDGISCLMGTLATDAHVVVANQAVLDAVKGGATQAQGVQIATAAILEAAHTCE